MATSDNTEVKDLNIKLFELMEAVRRDFEQKGTEIYYSFRTSDYKSAGRSIQNGYFFPGKEIPYVNIYNKNRNESYQIELTKDKNNNTFSSLIHFYKNNKASRSKGNDFKNNSFVISGQRYYIVKDEEWNAFIQKMIIFFSDNEQLFDFSSPQTRKNYEKNIKNIRTIVSQAVNSINTVKGAPVSPKGSVNSPLNQILYGPPGTGKTYNTVNKALEIILGETAYSDLVNRAEQQSNHEDKRKVFTDEFKRLQDAGQIVFTTFHQSMSYEDFVEGIKPITNADGQLTYKVLPGIFKQICDEAQKASPSTNSRNSDKPNVETDKIVKPTYNYVLIIDEINRGNVSQIFGELITLIEEDKRLGKPEAITVKLPYSSTSPDCTKTGDQDEVFGVPQNLYIIGTMNTADRSVEALDTALRRRFSFEEMMPKYKDEEAQGIESIIKIDGVEFRLSKILQTINKRIEVLKGRELQIGHSYLMKCRNTADLKTAFKDKIVPLLQEYFYGDYSQIGLVLGQGFVKTDKDGIAFADGFDAPDQSEVTYYLLSEDEWEKLEEEKNMREALSLMNIQQNE